MLVMTCCFKLSTVIGQKVEGAITMSLRVVDLAIFIQLFVMPFTWLKNVPHGAINEFYLYCHIVGVCGRASFVPVPYTGFFLKK